MKLNKLWYKDPVSSQISKDLINRNIKQLNIDGLRGSSISFLIPFLINEQNNISPLLFLTDNKDSTLHLFQDIISFTGLEEDENIFIFPSFEILPYENSIRDALIIEQRMKVLAILALSQKRHCSSKVNHPYPSPLVIISNYKAILSKIISIEDFNNQYRKIEVNSQLLTEVFLDYLIGQGYQSSFMIEQHGQFSQRGGIIDVFPFTEENPVRIELNGDRIESIRFFDIESQRSISRVNKITLLPQKELGDKNLNKIKNIGSFFDYLPSDTNIIIQQLSKFKSIVEEYEKESQKIYLEKQQNNNKQNILPPDYYYLNWPQVNKELYQKKKIIVLESENLYKNSIAGNIEKREYKVSSSAAKNYYGQLGIFFNDLKQWQKENNNILILTANKGRVARMAEIFSDRGVQNFQILPLEKAKVNSENICLSYGKVNYGFTIPSLELVVVTDQEIFGRERDKSYHTKRYLGKSFHQVDELKQGDYVVHIQHGIGRYAGIYSKISEGVNKDYLLIKYAKDDELYVPVDQLNLVHKYIGVGGKVPKLYRLGGTSWKRVKKRVRESIHKTARELFELYKQRKSVQGFPFSADSVWQQELEMSFPFEETPDQGKALLDVKKDMESPQPMERLICGDVGYGKTEIAIRAAFKAVMDNKQVAILAPTTILAQQHWENFSERMKTFPLRIEMLSRFKSKKEQQDIIYDLEKGKVDIVIGTHRLVQNDVTFRDLGLLIVDEEQRFGVIHKERIKKLREQIDSLTLTATPIPRTLYFSLTGVREMSLINTPPELRLPIVTYLKEKNNGIIQEAVRREINRGGQVFYVHNRVENIDYIASELSKIIPEAKIIVAHGQMQEEQLENIMIDFLNKKYDILVCTTIIEIGLDIPNVNTIIIDEAHKFGLAQLYQLRGRVGRSDRRAYAYLLYPSGGIITDNAKKRLEAIREFSDLGSGFRLAMRDLEIRGAGNLLGKEQHGFVSEIGFNFYCQLLEDSIDELKHLGSGEIKKEDKEPEMNVKIDSYIPDNYIFDSENRVNYYQKLSKVKSEDELCDISVELKDIYGSYPQEVSNLINVIDLKLKLIGQGVSQVKITPGYFSMRFEIDSPIESKLKRINFNKSLVSYYKRGSYGVLKLLPEIKKNDNNSINILKQSRKFLDNIIKNNN